MDPIVWEVEQKFTAPQPEAISDALLKWGAAVGAVQQHADTYYGHPCRRFEETGEAFRLRLVDGLAHVTYKGPKLPGTVKARRELEWPLGPSDATGEKMAELLKLLGFTEVATVRKRRQSFKLCLDGTDFTCTIDDCEAIGNYVEIERVVEARDQIDAARESILRVAEGLSLGDPEPRSYLTMLLERGAKDGS